MWSATSSSTILFTRQGTILSTPHLLQSLGGPLGDGISSSIVRSIITEFTNEFRTVIDGNMNDLSLNELSDGARISFVFLELFNVGVKSINTFDQVKDGDIQTILDNSPVRAEFSGRY